MHSLEERILILETEMEEFQDSLRQLEPPSEPQWISVDDRLPEEEVEVLLKFQYGMTLGQFGEWHGEVQWIETWEGTKVFGVTHWMPLPPPPEKEA